jgi:DNA-binding transcriptional LysR family regulator
MKKYPDLAIEIIATDHVLDIVRDSIDVAVRIAEVDDTSLVARKLAPCHRIFCASPAYLKEFGTPKTLSDVSSHKVVVENNAAWRLQGPEGNVSLKLSSEIKTNSSEIVHQAVVCGCGIGFLSTWEVRDDLMARKLVPLLPQYREAPGVAIYAVYPDKHFIPARLRVFVEFLEAAYGPTPYWDEGLDLPARSAAKGTPQLSKAVAEL